MRLVLLASLCALSLPAAAQDVRAASDGPTPVLADTVRAADVDEDNGRAVMRATGEPVTGTVVDTYPSGARRMRRSVVDGRAEGLWAEWYESGVPRYLATWRAGRGDGVWTYFHPNGEVRERVAVSGDAYTGPVEGWHANGRKAFEGVYRANERDGTWRFWSEDGALDRTEVYRDGERADG